MPGDRTAKPAKKTPYQKRDMHAEFRARYPNAATEDPETRLAPFRAFVLKPLAPSTLAKIAAIEAWWIAIYADHYKIGEEEARKLSFTKGAAVPEIAFMRLFLEVLHKTGQSKLGLPKVVGLSKRTLLNTFRQVTIARNRSGAEPFTQDYCQQIVNLIHQWAAECNVTSRIKDKYIIRLQDYEDLCGVSVSGVHGITDLFMRLQMVILLGILFFTGQRPGAIIEGAGYRGSKQCLLWGRTELVLTGYKPGYGPQFEFVMTLDWVKNMRFDDSKFIVISLRSLAADKVHIDPLLAIIAHGIELGVWTEDVSRFFGKNPQLPTRFPHPIPVSPNHQDRPLLENAKRTGAMTFSTATYHMGRCSGALGLSRKNLYMARGNAALEMGDTQAKHKLQYLMGHTINSNTVLSSAYQPRQCGLDNTGVIAHETQNSNLSRLMVSASYKQHTSDTLSPAEQAQFLQVLTSDLAASLEIAREVVKTHDAMVKVLGEDAEDTHPDNPLVIEYSEAAIGAEQFFHQALDRCIANPKLVGIRPGEGQTQLLIKVFLPIYEAFRDAVLTKAANAPAELIDGLTSSAFIHPGRAVLKQEDPVSGMLDFYRDMLQTGRKYKEGECIFCQMRHQPTPSSAKLHWGRHLYGCEQQLRAETESRCHVCMVFIRNPVAADADLGISVEDVEYSQHIYDAHHEDCHENLVERLLSGNAEDDRCELDAAHLVQGVGVVVKKGKGKGKEAKAAPKAKVQTIPAYLEPWTLVMRMTTKDMPRIWCPVCLFNPNLPWDQRHHVTHTSTEFQYHLVTHFGCDRYAFRHKATDTGIAYDRTHLCYVGDCDGETYTTGPFIEHLHNDHGIPLIRCNRSHAAHSPDCYRLQPEFRYYEQAVEEAKHPMLGLPMPETCLIEYRKAQTKKASISRVQDRSKAAAEVSPSPPALPTAIPTPVTAVAASATAPVATSADYSVQSFCVDFNLSRAVVAKIEAIGHDVFPLGDPCLHEMDESDWNNGGFTEAERITLLRKHQHLLDSKTLGMSPLPLPPHFYPMLAGTTISDFAKAVGLSDVSSASLEKMGFSLDDPEGMANLSDDAWKVAGFKSSFETSFVKKKIASYLKEKAQL